MEELSLNPAPDPPAASLTPQVVSLTYEQQKELLELQLERDKLVAKERAEQRNVEAAEKGKRKVVGV